MTLNLGSKPHFWNSGVFARITLLRPSHVVGGTTVRCCKHSATVASW